MADYDIYVLEEDDISFSGGAQLDGVTQGDGSHLMGVDITLNTNAWQPISITDNDTNFQDSDSSQQLDGPATLNGITYGDGTVVEAEYAVVVSDGTNSWTLIGFNVNNSSPAYGTVEGLAFIGGSGGFPPVGVPLTVTSTIEGPNFVATDYATPICMAAGTFVEPPTGPRKVEQIAVGDPVLTRDHGPQPVRWHGVRRVLCRAGFAPVRFAPQAIGNTRPLLVSQQHRVLVEGWQAELLFGTCEVLVPAVHLVNADTITLIRSGEITYHHLLLDAHAVIATEGVWTESLHPGAQALKSLMPKARHELFSLFPELDADATTCAQHLAYPSLKQFEAGILRPAASGGRLPYS